MEKVKALFLISIESPTFEVLVQKINELREYPVNEIIVISLTVLTSQELQRRGIKYKTPEHFFDKSSSEKLDYKALDFAKNWYKPFEQDLYFNGVPLGEMVESEFYFYFVDVLRSIVIAQNIITDENFNLIYSFENNNLEDPYIICYETLPEVLEFFSNNNNNISFKIIEEKQENKPKLTLLRKFGFNCYVKSIDFYYNIFLSNYLKLFKNKKFIAFYGVYSYKTLIPFLKPKNFYPLKLYPMQCSNDFTKKKINELQLLYHELRQKNFELGIEFNNVNLFLILERRLENTFTSKFPGLIEIVAWADNIINRVPLDMLIVMEDASPIKKTLCKFFKHNNIPSLVIQHGMVTTGILGLAVMPLVADIQAVWGERILNWHYDKGNKKQFVTGNPSFDKLHKIKIDKEKICHKLGFDPSKKIILVTLGRFSGISAKYTVESEERLIYNTLQSLRNFSDEQIVVKLHPAYQERYSSTVLNIAKELGVEIKLFKDSLWDLFAISDILITFSSTTGLEAMLFDLPVLIVDFEYNEDLVGYVSSGAAISVYNKKDLESSIETVLYDTDVREKLSNHREQFLYETTFLDDGNASKRVANLIIDFVMKNE